MNIFSSSPNSIFSRLCKETNSALCETWINVRVKEISVASSKVICLPEALKYLLVESKILLFGIRKTDLLESGTHWGGILNHYLGSGVCIMVSGIQNYQGLPCMGRYYLSWAFKTTHNDLLWNETLYLQGQLRCKISSFRSFQLNWLVMMRLSSQSLSSKDWTAASVKIILCLSNMLYTFRPVNKNTLSKIKPSKVLN